MKRLPLITILLLMLAAQPLYAQFKKIDGNTTNTQQSESGEVEDGAGNRVSWGGREAQGKNDDEKEKIPIGQFQWRIDPRLGIVISAENNDTIVHNYQNFNLTEGYTGQYSFLGNLGAPRLNRIYLNREDNENFIFVQPLSYFRTGLSDFRFTNTLSPITNLSYNKCGNAQNGEDRIRAYFASNINKVSGIGFKIDYLYGRGYYNSSSTSQFGGTLYGYHLGEKYNMHAYMNIEHMKEAESGGIEDDKYIEDPQSFPQSYGSTEIPVTLSNTWNRNHEQTYYLNQKFNVGFYRDLEVPDSLKPKMPSESELLMQLNDSIREILHNDSVARKFALDSLKFNWEKAQVTPREFIPVTSFIHTIELRRLNHTYLAEETPDTYYTNHYYGSWSAVEDETKALSLRNTIGIALREGFNKWAAMGINLFATHQLRTYNLPVVLEDSVGFKNWKENDLSIGAQLIRQQGKLIHYNAEGEMWLAGENVGDFRLDGQMNVNLHVGKVKNDSIQIDKEKKDSILFTAHAYLKHETPGFYLRHYHSQSTWWDNNDLSRQLKSRIEGSLEYSKSHTRLTVGLENVTNYTYFGMENTLLGTDSTSTTTADYSHNVAVMQKEGNVQVFSATLNQDLALGPIHWDNELTYQKSSDDKVLPLPQFNAYSNLYLLFHIAKVLRVQVGGDVRYFTSYYAPDYTPCIQQFAVQDADFGRVKIGNYPIVNCYVNLHLKHCRIYLAMNHVNQGSGHAFWAPHYAINPRNFHFGVSWNFFN